MPFQKSSLNCVVGGFRFSKDVDFGLLELNDIRTCKEIPTFRRRTVSLLNALKSLLILREQ